MRLALLLAADAAFRADKPQDGEIDLVDGNKVVAELGGQELSFRLHPGQRVAVDADQQGAEDLRVLGATGKTELEVDMRAKTGVEEKAASTFLRAEEAATPDRAPQESALHEPPPRERKVTGAAAEGADATGGNMKVPAAHHHSGVDVERTLHAFVQKQQTLFAKSMPGDTRFVVYDPRAGLGNKMLGLVSSVVAAVALDRRLLLKPGGDTLFGPANRFECSALFRGQLCDWQMPPALLGAYSQARRSWRSYRVLYPDQLSCVPTYTNDLETLLCDDQLEAEPARFLEITSDEYYAPLLFGNPALKERLQNMFRDADGDIAVFRPILRLLFKPADSIQLRVSELNRQSRQQWPLLDDRHKSVCVTVRHSQADQPEDFGRMTTCLDALKAEAPTAPIFLATMHADVRAAMQRRYGSDVSWATDDHPTDDGLGNAAHEQSAVLDVWLLSQCSVLLYSSGSTFSSLPLALGNITAAFSDKTPGAECTFRSSEKPATEPLSDIFRRDECGVLARQGHGACGSVPLAFMETTER